MEKGLKQLRDRCKQRNFDKQWESYTDAFKTYFASLSRDSKTALINQGITKNGKTLQNHIMQSFEAMEEVKRKKQRQNELGHQGYILEQAEAILGGGQKLREAVSRGWGIGKNIEQQSQICCQHFLNLHISGHQCF